MIGRPGDKRGFGRLCAIALLTAGCGGEEKVPAPGGGPGRGQTVQRDGGPPSDAAAYSPRPDGAALLPKADDELSLALNAPAVSLRIELDAAPQVLDVHFSVDTTGSMGGEIDELQHELRESIVPELNARIASVAFGVSSFEDFPHEPFGLEDNGSGFSDSPFDLLTPVTSNLDRVAIAVAHLDQPLGFGGDNPESDAEALWQIATGEGYTLGKREIIEPFNHKAAEGGGSLGGVGFREGALRVVLHVTDAPSHEPADYVPLFPDTHSLGEAGDALAALDCRLVSIVSAPCTASEPEAGCNLERYLLARSALESVALRTQAVTTESSPGFCAHGIDGTDVPSIDGECPLVFDISAEGEGLSRTLIDAITDLVDGTRFQLVRANVSDDPVGFVERVEPVPVRQAKGADPPMIEDRLPESAPDGEPDTFVAVRSKTRLAFDIWLRNRNIASTDVAQRFRVIVQVLGDGLIIAERTIRVVIPPSNSLVPPQVVDDDAG